MLAENHQYKVAKPNDVETEEDTDDAGNNLAITESGKDTANPACYGDDCKNQTNDVTQTEIVSTFFCHN